MSAILSYPLVAFFTAFIISFSNKFLLNHCTGYVEPAEIDEFHFEDMRRTYHTLGEGTVTAPSPLSHFLMNLFSPSFPTKPQVMQWIHRSMLL